MAELMRPESIHWVDGSQEEYEALCGQMVASGTFINGTNATITVEWPPAK